MLAQPELLTPPLATLPMSRGTLLFARHPLPLSLLRHARERAGAGGRRLGLRSAHPHHLQAKQ
jgi:hypothetical protein